MTQYYLNAGAFFDPITPDRRQFGMERLPVSGNPKIIDDTLLDALGNNTYHLYRITGGGSEMVLSLDVQNHEADARSAQAEFRDLPPFLTAAIYNGIAELEEIKERKRRKAEEEKAKLAGRVMTAAAYAATVSDITQVITDCLILRIGNKNWDAGVTLAEECIESYLQQNDLRQDEEGNIYKKVT